MIRRALIPLFLALALTGPAGAGVLRDDDGKPVSAAEHNARLQAEYEALKAAFLQRNPDLLIPLNLTDAPPRPCDVTQPGRSFAVMVDGGAPGMVEQMDLQGTVNDVHLLARALEARGVEAGRITKLIGQSSNRAAFRQALDDLLGELTCTDAVILYFSGHFIKLDEFAAFEGVEGDTWLDHKTARDDPLRRELLDAGPFLTLNAARDAPAQTVSSQALSDALTLLRNTGANVTVIMDTMWAASAALQDRQRSRDPATLWQGQVALDSDNPSLALTTEDGRPLLQPGHGALTTIYGTHKTGTAVEMRLPRGAADRKTHGLFTFRLAAAIQSDPTLTTPGLLAGIQAFARDKARSRNQTSVIQSTAPQTPILAELVPPPAESDAIRILTPRPTRAAAALEEETLRITGQVEWPEDTLIVLVNKQQALSRPNGQFEHEIVLQSGANDIEIVAMTRDERQHRKVLQVTYEGDQQALLGRGARYAILIANQNYTPGSRMPSLATPHADADAIAAELTTRYGFRTTARMPDGQDVPLILKDASRNQIETLLFQMSRIAGERDTVLIYYGGHGIYEQMTQTAFWVPSNAQAGVPISYLSASAISEAIQRIQAGNILIVSDSCYSGALLREAVAPPQPIDQDRLTALQRQADRRSRVLITSGSNEPVEDGGGDGHSVFARAFLTGLREIEHDAFSANELFAQYILPFVVGHSEQEPQFRPVAKSGHEGGDVIFVRQ